MLKKIVLVSVLLYHLINDVRHDARVYEYSVKTVDSQQAKFVNN
jgi:hypothetical protein